MNSTITVKFQTTIPKAVRERLGRPDGIRLCHGSRLWDRAEAHRNNDREFCLERRKAELAAFTRVFEALPVDRLDYRPHERSPSAEALVWKIAGGP